MPGNIGVTLPTGGTIGQAVSLTIDEWGDVLRTVSSVLLLNTATNNIIFETYVDQMVEEQ